MQHLFPASRLPVLGLPLTLFLWAGLVRAEDPTTIPGQGVYDQHCATCHGALGDGNGPASVWLFPKPRDFSKGLFKIQSTPPGSLPADEDLFKTISQGMPGSAMPGFAYLSEAQRREAVGYVKQLTAFRNEEGVRVNRFEMALKEGGSRAPVAVPPEPPVTLASLVRGQELFLRLQCANCHGETGAGDGPQASELRDGSGMPIRPRDFNTGAFRGGHTGRDLYWRIRIGLAGTPMVPYGDDVITPQERWSLVHYILSLRRKEVEINDMLIPEDGGIKVAKVASKVPADPMDPLWERLDPVRVPLNPLWPEPYPIYAVAVTAVHDGRRLAILCQWRDAQMAGAPVRVQDFQDALAVQFSLKGGVPFLGMGDAAHPVNIWQWKAGWEQETDGAPRDLHAVYNSMHVDTYFQTQYATAAQAGNALALPHPSPVEDSNARGFGTLQAQSLSGQNVRGKGLWHDGFWSVVFLRNLRSRDAEDVQFKKGISVPVAFAVWNGEQGDRNGRKVVSNWFQLQFEP